VAVAVPYARAPSVNLSLYLLRMALGKRKWARMKKGAAMLPVDRPRFNGTTPEKTARLMMLQRFANSCELSRMALFCATISPAIVGGNWGPLDNCNNSYFLGGVVVPR
jgi:hypothetical protein